MLMHFRAASLEYNIIVLASFMNPEPELWTVALGDMICCGLWCLTVWLRFKILKSIFALISPRPQLYKTYFLLFSWAHSTFPWHAFDSDSPTVIPDYLMTRRVSVKVDLHCSHCLTQDPTQE